MTPSELGAYLDVLRGRKAVSAHVKTPNGEFAVTFAPDMEPASGATELTPGGWKGPERLDRDPLAVEEPSLP
jgi:hypothetical protein